VDGLEVAVDQTSVDEIGEDLEHGRLVGGVHREVGLVVVRQRQQPLHLPALLLDELRGVIAALASHGLPVHVPRPVAELLHHLVLDRQAVAVPAGDIGRAVAEHLT